MIGTQPAFSLDNLVLVTLSFVSAMKSIAKNLGKLNQFVGEKFSKAAKHELSEDFKILEDQTETRKEGAEAILDACLTYLKTLEKRTEAADKGKHLALQSFGLALMSYGSDLDEESLYGQALIKMGESEEKIGNLQNDFVVDVRLNFIKPMEEYMAEMKNYKHLKSKLENRRLDYDAKLNRLQKAKKEKPELDEEMRVAQQKYEETLQELEILMVSLNDREEVQLQDLLKFMDAQHRYHTDSAALLIKLKSTILDGNVRGNRLHPPRVPTFDGATPESARAPFTATGTSSPTAIRETEPSSALISVAGATAANGALSIPIHDPWRQPSTVDTVSSMTFTSPSVSRMESQLTNVSTGPSQKKLVRASYSFLAENPNELSLNKGDMITVLEEVDPGWWIGECKGIQGLFPANYCEQVSNPPPVESRQAPPPPYLGDKNSAERKSTELSIVAEESSINDQTSGLPRSTSIPRFSYMDPNGTGGSPSSLRKTQSKNNSQQNLHVGATPIVQVATCGNCGCTHFQENVFKPGHCNNCFHLH